MCPLRKVDSDGPRTGYDWFPNAGMDSDVVFEAPGRALAQKFSLIAGFGLVKEKNGLRGRLSASRSNIGKGASPLGEGSFFVLGDGILACRKKKSRSQYSETEKRQGNADNLYLFEFAQTVFHQINYGHTLTLLILTERVFLFALCKQKYSAINGRVWRV